MTCIVALKHGNAIYFGGDAAATDAWSMTTSRLTAAKFFQKDSFVIGVSGSPRDAQVIRYKVQLPKFFPGSDPDEFVFGAVIDEIRTALKHAGAVKVENSVETIESNILIAFDGRIYVLFSNFAVLSFTEPYAAVGSGQDLALGALYATSDFFDPKERVRVALEAAAAFNAGVSAPFTITKFEMAA